MSWLILVLISVITYSISVLLQRVLLKDDKSEPIAYSVFFQLIVGILAGVYGFFIGSMSLPNFKPIAFNIILMMFLYGFANVFIFTALKKTDASKFTVIFSARGFFTILASSIFLHETLTAKHWVGALFIFAGVILVSLKRMKLSFGKGDLLSLGAAICFGFANTNDRFLLEHFKLYPYLMISFITPAILISILYPKTITKFNIFLKRGNLFKILLLCIIYAVSAATFFGALQIGKNSSQVAVVNLTSIITAVILAIIFLKEREGMAKKIIGAALSFIGLLLLSQ